MSERLVDDIVRRMKIVASTRKGMGISSPIQLPIDRIKLLERHNHLRKYGDRWLFEDIEVIEHAGPARITKTHR